MINKAMDTSMNSPVKKTSKCQWVAVSVAIGVIRAPPSIRNTLNTNTISRTDLMATTRIIVGKRAWCKEGRIMEAANGDLDGVGSRCSFHDA